MHPVLDLFGWKADAAYFFMALGVVGMVVVNLLRAKKFSVSWWKAVLISLTNNVGAFAGAKLLFLLENWQDTLQNGVTFSGFSFYGTVFVLPLFMLATYHLYGMERRSFLDYSTPSVAVELALYRTGCLLAGCCYGVEAGWGIAMAHSPEVLRVPVQLFEIILDLGIFGGLLALERRRSFFGLLYPAFMVLYGAVRFVLEFFRVRQTWFWGMSEAHVLSLLAILIGAAWLLVSMRKRRAAAKR